MLRQIEKQPDGTMTMTTSGLHDHFPGYEIFVVRSAELSEQKLIYGFDPRQGQADPPKVFSIPGQGVYLADTVTGFWGKKDYSPLSLFSLDQQKVKTKTEIVSVPVTSVKKSQ